MRTEENLQALEAALLDNCGDFYGACKRVRLSPSFVRTWIGDDPAVAERFENARELGSTRLESAAIERAVYGVDKGVYYKGELVATEKEYSDKLLELLLKKRRKAEFGDDAHQTNVLVNLKNINVMPRANSYEEWLAMVGTAEEADKRAKLQPLLEDGTIEAEFTPVLPPPEEDPAMMDIL